MPEFVCSKCGSDSIYAVPDGVQIKVYCAKCQSFIGFTSYKKMKAIYKHLDEKDLSDSLSLRKIKKFSGVTKMTCSKCNCLLYNSLFPVVQGQFDLVNAKYCPNCGRELI